MGKLVFGMMQSLDGYVAGVAGGPGSDGYVGGLAAGLELPPPGVSLSRHFNDHVRGLAGSLCGRRMYEVMRYWDEDQAQVPGPVDNPHAAAAENLGDFITFDDGQVDVNIGRNRRFVLGVRREQGADPIADELNALPARPDFT